MTEKMTSLEYAKSFAPASRIPESFLTMGDVVHMLERIIQLNADLANANEGAKLMHSLATGGESRLDADLAAMLQWEDEKPVAKTINLNGYKATATASWRERHLNES